MRHLQSFRYLRAIVEAGSIRGASETLTISPSALNRHIQSLELDLNITLFERLTRGVRLSSEGELFYNFALSQLAGYDRVQSQIDSVRGKNIGALKIGLCQDLNLRFLHSLVAEFQREMNNVDISFSWTHQDSAFEDLKTRNLDMALMVNPRLRKGIKLFQAKDISLCAFVPLGTNFSKSETISLHELIGMRIALPPATSEVTQRVMAGFERNQLSPIVSYQGHAVIEHLEHTHLPMVGIQAFIDTDHASSQLPGYKRYFLTPRDIGTCNISLITGDHFVDTIASHRFQEMLNQAFQ